MKMAKEITVALAGNPNSGKTTVFNNLTGSRQHVGNWPGVTVEKKEGICHYQDYTIKVVDLPGVYSLTAYSLDEVIARNFIVEGKPDLVVQIVDASSLERNLYLTTQLLELGASFVLALNMADVAQSQGHQIDIKRLSQLLGVAVVPMVASRNEGTEELLQEIVKAAESQATDRDFKLDYGAEVEQEIAKLESLISRDEELRRKYSSRWLAIKLLEEDEEVIRAIRGHE
jgi:ferrous iron transport protein B